MPFWEETIVPAIKSGKKVIVVAHGNSLRAIVKTLSNVSEKGKYSSNFRYRVVKHSNCNPIGLRV